MSKLIESYAEDISYEKDIEIMSRIVELLKMEADIQYTGYLQLLLSLADRHSGSTSESEQAQKIYALVYEGFEIWSQRAVEKDLLLSTVSWEMFDHQLWRPVLASNLDKRRNFFCFLKNIKCKFPVDDNGSHLLKEGKLASIYFYLAIIWLRDLKDAVNSTSRKKYESIWIAQLFEFQGSLRILSGENIRLLGMHEIIEAYMKFLSVISEESQDKFIKKLEIKSEAYKTDLVFWFTYIENERIKEVSIKILSTIREDDFFKDICFITTMQNMIERACEIVFEIRNKKESLKSTDDDVVFFTLLKVLSKSLKSFEEEIDKKGKFFQDDYTPWLKFAKNKLLVLENKTGEILAGEDTFYKGIIYLEQNNIEDLRKAVDIFSAFYEQEKWSKAVNYPLALVKLIGKLKQDTDEYAEELKTFYSVFEKFEKIYKEDIKIRIHLYSSWLCLCQELNLSEEFWKLYQKMAEADRTDISCARFIIPVLIREKSSSLASKLLEALKKRYGETSELNQMEADVKKKMSNPPQSGQPKAQMSGGFNIETIRAVLKEIPDLCREDLSNVFLNNTVEPAAYEDFMTYNMSGQTVAHILKLLCPVLNNLQEYTSNIFRCADTPLIEDMYNKTVMEFFNMHVPWKIGYHMRDQSQGGGSGQHRETGIGSRDLIISHQRQGVMLIEGIRLRALDSEYIKKHIAKLRNYNDAEYSLMAMLIYYHGNEANEFWGKYKNYMKELKKNNTCDMKSVVEDIDLKKIKIEDKPRFICKTKHEYNGNVIDVYHIMMVVFQAEINNKEVHGSSC